MTATRQKTGRHLLFVTSHRVWGGGEEWFVSMARGLEDRGHRVHFVCQPGGPVAERARAANLEVHELSIRGELNPKTYRYFAALFKEHRYDAALVARSREAKIVGMAAKVAGGPPLIRVYGNHKPIPETPIYRYTYTKLVRHIVAPSQAICDLLRESHPWLPKDSVQRIAIGVEPAPGTPKSDTEKAREEVRSELGLTNGVPLIASIGRLEDIKGHRFLIEALARLRRSTNGVSAARGIVVGDGCLKDSLVTLAEESGVGDRVTLPGFRSDVGAVLNAADIVAMPSLSEGFPLAVLEAMMAGRPVVASRVGGIPEMIVDGETGLLVPPKDPGALASALAWLIASPSLRDRLGKAAKERALREFHRPRMLDRLEGYLEGVLA